MLDKDKKWRWCLVGNIVKDHAYGESKEILIGTKHFQPGAKVYMAPANWGDGYEKYCCNRLPAQDKALYRNNHALRIYRKPSIKKGIHPIYSGYDEKLRVQLVG